MKNKDKTQKLASKELTHVRRRIAALEASERKRKQGEKALLSDGHKLITLNRRY
jgi:hypothetical protein